MFRCYRGKTVTCSTLTCENKQPHGESKWATERRANVRWKWTCSVFIDRRERPHPRPRETKWGCSLSATFPRRIGCALDYTRETRVGTATKESFFAFLTLPPIIRNARKRSVTPLKLFVRSRKSKSNRIERSRRNDRIAFIETVTGGSGDYRARRGSGSTWNAFHVASTWHFTSVHSSSVVSRTSSSAFKSALDLLLRQICCCRAQRATTPL